MVSPRDASGGAAPASCRVRERLPCARAVPGSGARVLTSRAELPLCGGRQAAGQQRRPGVTGPSLELWDREGWVVAPLAGTPACDTEPCGPLGPRLGPGLPRQDGRAGQAGIAGAGRPLSRVPPQAGVCPVRTTQRHPPCADAPEAQPAGPPQGTRAPARAPSQRTARVSRDRREGAG